MDDRDGVDRGDGITGHPGLITNTMLWDRVTGAPFDWIAANNPELAAAWLPPVVGETYDGYLNDTNCDQVTAGHAVAATESARSGPVEEGSVGRRNRYVLLTPAESFGLAPVQ